MTQKLVNFSETKSSVNTRSKIFPIPYGTDIVIADDITKHVTEAPIIHFSGLASLRSLLKSDVLTFFKFKI